MAGSEERGQTRGEGRVGFGTQRGLEDGGDFLAGTQSGDGRPRVDVGREIGLDVERVARGPSGVVGVHAPTVGPVTPPREGLTPSDPPLTRPEGAAAMG